MNDLLRKMASYGNEVEIYGSLERGKAEVFLIRLDGAIIGEPIESWPEALTKFRDAVQTRKNATSQ